MSVHRVKEDQERANMLKVIRAAVRLKYSIQADNELNELLPKAEAYFESHVNRGQLPSVAEVRKAVGI